MRTLACIVLSLLLTEIAWGQVQVELKFKRVQYVAYEPVIAIVQITNLAGRDIELRDDGGQAWFGFEITAAEEALARAGTADSRGAA
jgi:hypothetical protein